MSVLELRSSLSLDSLWEALVYTLVRGENDEVAKDLLAAIEALVERVGRVRVEQWARWRVEIAAQAAVDAANDRLDAGIDDFARTLDNELRDKKDPAWKRYFPVPPSNLIALGLESEVKAVRSWPEWLAADPTPALQAFAPRFRDLIVAGDSALETRRQAEIARANHRAHEIDALFADANDARRTLHAQLSQRAVERRLGRKWADGFFRHGRKHEPEPQPT